MEVVAIPWGELQSDDELVAWQEAVWTHVYEVAQAVKHFKRRLGPDAGSDDLALDKKLAGKVMYAAQSQIGLWTDKRKDWDGLPQSDACSEEIRQEAAVVNWFEWLPAQLKQCMSDELAYAVWLEDRSLFSKRLKLITYQARCFDRLCQFILKRSKNAMLRSASEAAVNEYKERKLDRYVQEQGGEAGGQTA